MALTRSFLDDDQFKSMREDVMSRLKMHYTYDKKGLPFRIGGNWFHYCTKGLQNQSVLYITGPTADGTPEVFYDVNTESSDGTTSISRLSAERTGFHYGLIGLRERGSDWSTFYWFDSARRGPIRPSTVSSGSNDLGIDVVKGKFISTSLVNRPSRTGYFYSSYPTPVTTEVLRKRGLWCEAASTPTDSATSKDTNYAAWYHADGTSQANDVPIFLLRGREADWFYGASVTTDGRFVVVDASDGCDPSTNIYVSAFDAAPLEACARARRDARLPTATDAERSAVAGPPVAPELNFLTLVTGMDTAWTYVHNYTDGDEEVFLFVTNRPSPKKQLRAIRVPLKAFATAPRTPVGDEPPLAPGMRIVDVIAADDHEVLDYVTPGCGGKFLIVAHTVDVCDCISIYALDGKLVRRLRLPVGTITGTSCSVLHEHVFFRIGSYVSPGTDLYMDTSAPAFQAALAGGPQADGPVVQGVTLDEFVQAVGNVKVPGFNPDDYMTERVFYESTDGTKIPLFITHHTAIVPSSATDAPPGAIKGPHPCSLYGYGGFNISLQPTFSTLMLPWLAMNGFRAVSAVACIRGGGEYGHEWYTSAIKEKKHISWDDFGAAAKYLSDHGWTTRDLLNIRGGSNGGLLVSSTAMRFPQDIGSYVAEVGVFDLTRFHTSHVGAAWRSDYGDPDTEDIRYIATTSPTLVVERDAERLRGKMPYGLVVTADHDDRVSPFHSFKFVSAAQHALPATLTLCRLEKNVGHGAGRPTDKTLADRCDQFIYMARVHGLKWHGDA